MTGEVIRVLVAASDQEALEELRAALPRAEGFSLTEAADPSEAAAALDGRRHDLLILELGGPEAAALEELVLGDASRGAPPVVALAGKSQEASALRALRRGFADYLLTGELSGPVVTRTVRFATEQARAERRRRQAEGALTDSEHRYRSLFEQSRDAIFMTDPAGVVLEVNRAGTELLGHSHDDLIGREVLSVLADPGDRERFRREIAAGDELLDFEARVNRQDGEERWCRPHRRPAGAATRPARVGLTTGGHWCATRARSSRGARRLSAS